MSNSVGVNHHWYHNGCQCAYCQKVERDMKRPAVYRADTGPLPDAKPLVKTYTPFMPSGPVSMPDGYDERKALPIVTGCMDYFPDALLAVAECSQIANEQHNPGEPLHWAREKSTDEVNTLGRHLLQRGTRDKDGIRHSAKVAWRALAMLQKEIEAERK